MTYQDNIHANLLESRTYWESLEPDEIVEDALIGINTALLAPAPLSDTQWEYFLMRLGIRQCKTNLDGSVEVLAEMGVPESDISTVLIILETFGGYCDCEVFMNAVEKITEPVAS